VADDVTVDNGGLTDYVVATDDIGSGRQAQLMKLLYSADGSATALLVDANGMAHQGSVAEDAALAGNPVRQGGRASTAVPTAMSADGDLVTIWLDRSGAQMVVPRLDQLLITVTPTIDTAVYAAGDRLGSVMTLTSAAIGNGRTGTLAGALFTDDANSVLDIDVAFFQNTPTLVNADNGVYDITDANLATAVPLGWVNFSTANSYSQGSSNRTCIGTWLGGPCAMPYKCASGDSAIYGIAVARGAYDAAATDDLIFHFTVVRD
jgi:hypothetical protein